jgi:hypothetical protein
MLLANPLSEEVSDQELEPDELEAPDMTRLVRQGLEWAAR